MTTLRVLLITALFLCSAHGFAWAAEGEESFVPEEWTQLTQQEDMESKQMQEMTKRIMGLATAITEVVPDTYKVQQGDNLYRIALQHEITLSSLMEWNGLTDELIHPGDILIVNEEAFKKEVHPSFVQKKPKRTQLAVAAASVKKKASSKETTPSAPLPSRSTAPSGGREMTVTATAYTAYCEGCSGTTAYGINLRANPNQKVIAVDPRVIPLGTKVWVEGYGEAIAGDTGGAIKGNKIDVFIPSHEGAVKWGVKKVKIKVLN